MTPGRRFIPRLARAVQSIARPKTLKVVRLDGPDHAPPAQPRLGSPKRDRGEAKLSGGIFASNGEQTITAAEGELLYLVQIDSEADAAIDHVAQGFIAPTGNSRKAAADARHQAEHAARERARLRRACAELARNEEELADRRGLKPLGYFLVLGFLYLVAFPFDRAAATGLPFSPGLQLLVALGLSGLLLVSAHWAAEKKHDYEEARAQAAERPERCRTQRAWYLGLLGGSALTIVAIGAWRLETFQAEATLTGGVLAGGPVADLVFTLLTALAFLAAFFAADKYLWLKPLRDSQAKRTANQREQQDQQQIIDTAERIQAQARLTLQSLDETEAAYLTQIESWRRTRRDAFMHKARVHEHKARQRQLPDGQPVGAVAPRRLQSGQGDGESRLLPLDTGDEAAAQAGANGGSNRRTQS